MSAVVIAPFANGDIRDWPAEHFRDLIGLLLARGPRELRIHLIGAAGQRLRACEIVRPFDAGRVIDHCGRLAWSGAVELIRSAACVIGDNSGVTHLAGLLGAPAVCVFSGAHQRLQWRPPGFTVVTLSRVIGCSPCDLVRARDCPYDQRCLRLIAPETVADAALALMAGRAATEIGA